MVSTVYSVQCTVYSVQCTGYRLQATVITQAITQSLRPCRLSPIHCSRPTGEGDRGRMSDVRSARECDQPHPGGEEAWHGEASGSYWHVRSECECECVRVCEGV